MKIVYTVLLANVAGGEIVCLEQMRAARKRGHVVCILVPAYGSTMEIAKSEGFEVHILPLEHTFQLQKALIFAYFLRKWGADIVHTHTCLPGMVLTRLGAFLAGVPIICHVHLDHSYNHNLFIGLLQRTADNLTAYLCQIVAVSTDTRQRLVSVGNPANHVQMIPNGVNIPEYGHNAKNDRLSALVNLDPTTLIVGCVARLAPIKGQHDLLVAATRIINEAISVKFVFIGSDSATEGRYEKVLRATAERQSVADHVHFTGYQPHAAMLMADFDLFVLPSYREAMPMSILEAMAAGKPVVATNVNGIPEVVIDGVTGFLVPPGDPDALAEAILTLLKDPDLARTMGQAGRTRVEEYFNLDKLHERIFALYDEAINKNYG